ncbi:MAG: ABC transporter permease [Christensenellaceae bacterium]|nr:ABC transporter permease [Christensenellaceae bacterium]
MQTFKKLLKAREIVIFAVVLLMFIVMCFASPYFLSASNLLAVLLNMSLDAIMVVGMVNLMVSGGFDMSVGSTLALAGTITALLINAGVPSPICFVGGLLTGAVVGTFNGFCVSRLGIVPFVTTLASQSMARGLVLVMSGGKNLSINGASFCALGQGKIGPVQLPVIYMIVIVVLGAILLSKSRFFRQNYYIGGNRKAAQLSGIHVSRMTLINYVIMGTLAGFAGVVMAARLGAASTTAGVGNEMKVISAVLSGGASMSGGEGTIVGGFLGCSCRELESDPDNAEDTCDYLFHFFFSCDYYS